MLQSYLLTAIGLISGGRGYFTCIQNMTLIATKFKSGGLHEQHVHESYIKTYRHVLNFLLTYERDEA
jgi:hypothetical protein